MAAFFRTERLELRPFTEDDAERLWSLESDPEVMRHIGRPALPDVEACREHIRRKCLPHYGLPDGYGAWVVQAAAGEFVGVCSVMRAATSRLAAEMQYGPGEAEIGYGLRRPAWGQGYATEVARALVGWALTMPEVRRVVASVSAENVASVRVLEKAGLHRAPGLFQVAGERGPSYKYVRGL